MKSAGELLRQAGVKVLTRSVPRATGQRATAAPEPPEVVDQAAATGPTACVVTCHNYGRFLRQCLDSLLSQSLPFDWIVVVDDSSDDDTPGIVASYAPRVRYVRGEWRDACLARQAGVDDLQRSRFLLFVDADNWLAPNFHERLRAAMGDPRLGVAYGTISVVDENGKPRGEELARPFEYDRLRRHNYVDTCSLVRTEAYIQAGGFEPVGGLQDWALWLKITRAGWRMKLVPDAPFFYRKHGASMTANRVQSGMNATGCVEVMRRAFTITIVTLFSGREWMLDRYARFIRGLSWSLENLRIVAIDNSRDPVFHARLQAALTATGVPFILSRSDRSAVTGHAAAEVCDSRVLRTGHGYMINEHLAHLYSAARELVPSATDLVWVLEDDIEPPTDVLAHFCRGFALHLDAGVITGCVRNRFGHRLIAWRGRWDYGPTDVRSAHLSDPPPLGQYERITAAGFHCTIFRREAWNALAFRPSPYWSARQPYYDWAAAHQIELLGWKWMISGSARCLHWQADGTALPAEGSTQDLCTGYA